MVTEARHPSTTSFPEYRSTLEIVSRASAPPSAESSTQFYPTGVRFHSANRRFHGRILLFSRRVEAIREMHSGTRGSRMTTQPGRTVIRYEIRDCTVLVSLSQIESPPRRSGIDVYDLETRPPLPCPVTLSSQKPRAPGR